MITQRIDARRFWGKGLGWIAGACLVVLGLSPVAAWGQEAGLVWSESGKFRYNLLGVSFDSTTRAVTVVFSVTNPLAGNTAYNVLDLTKPPFVSPATLRVDVGWNAGKWGLAELVNTGSMPGGAQLTSVIRGWMNSTPPSPGGIGPAYPNVVNALSPNPALAAKPCTAAGSPCSGTNVFWVRSTLPPQAEGTVRVAIEGHPVIQTGVDAVGNPVYGNIPVKGVYQDLAITTGAAARRQIVEISKCKVCHDGATHDNVVIPRLSLHGGNRTEEPGLCVVCHNPNQTDAAYRSSGAEESIDFKRMVHGIHAGGFRKNPLVIIGFRGAVNDFSTVRFPKELRNCMLCHIDRNGKGTFELSQVSKLGSTIGTVSQLSPLPGYVDVNPENDLRISPIAAACSACHDSSEVRRHMVSKGASFGVTQTTLQGKEQCQTCHGPGRERDVRKVHEVGEH